MASFYGKKVRVPVTLGGKDCYFFYSMACGNYLMEHFGTPEKAHKAYYSVILKTDEEGNFAKDDAGNIVGRTDNEIFADKNFYETFAVFVHAMTISWAKDTGVEPINFFDLSADEAGLVIKTIAEAFGLAMPKSDETAPKADPQKP